MLWKQQFETLAHSEMFLDHQWAHTESTTWGDVMNAGLANAILAFLESPRDGTRAGLRRFLLEPGFRKQFLSSVSDPEIRYYWEKQHPAVQGKPETSIVTRLDGSLRPKAIRHMVCQRESRLDFTRVMHTSKVFPAKLPSVEGRPGGDVTGRAGQSPCPNVGGDRGQKGRSEAAFPEIGRKVRFTGQWEVIGSGPGCMAVRVQPRGLLPVGWPAFPEKHLPQYFSNWR